MFKRTALTFRLIIHDETSSNAVVFIRSKEIAFCIEHRESHAANNREHTTTM
jgi:hypothetical protein